MKRFSIALLFLFTLLAPTSAWAIPVLDLFHPIIAAIQTPIHWIGSWAGSVNAASNVATNSWEMGKGISAPGLAAASPVIVTEEQANIKTAYGVSTLHHDLQDEYNKDVIPSKTGFRSFWDLANKVNLVLSGNYEDFSWSALETKFKEAFSKFMDQFTTKALEQTLDNLMTDILSCNTPQLALALPSFNLDFGFAFCDYGKMFSDMKRQAKAISKTSWGGLVKVNGQNIDDLLDDPSSLSDAIQSTSPGVGHTLALDMLSETSTNASVQASVDATGMQRQMQTLLNQMTQGKIFGDMTPVEREKLKNKFDGVNAQMQAELALTHNQLLNNLNSTNGITAKLNLLQQKNAFETKSNNFSQNLR